MIDRFHNLYYDSHTQGKTWHDTYFFGIPVQKCPLDLHIFQDIIYDVKPDVIIETGTASGGSTYYMACLCDFLGKGKIVTVDINKWPNLPKHKRIKYISGSSIDETVLEKIKKSIHKNDKVLAVLDSNHTAEYVLKELKAYSGFVTKGSYIIVEDTNVNGHPVFKEHGPGPMEALTEFKKTNNQFISDISREKYLLTFNPNGYLKRIH
ncbi:MAG: cephalosporin hydroxylase [Candidatus Levybacteria bacterium RIFCSPLOWO2_01_FULL_39_24]|nr:MAG: cephalosporin hydroxylase [Candidatus Levybacteria bacterium RIFCSPHIGHO2_01_FULL_40_16]OGH46290.1 MAG: cephalosporin hydroxylase [Candidatus Levybacteria bacterium RIFCSPLOWO2_01_FULL_39_24]